MLNNIITYSTYIGTGMYNMYAKKYYYIQYVHRYYLHHTTCFGVINVYPY